MKGFEVSEGLIDDYVSQIQILAVKAEAGALVDERVRRVVHEAAARFAAESVERGSDLEAFVGRLGREISRIGNVREARYKRTLRLASECARERCRAFA